ncbi:cupin domain-containing protein [Sedimentimonas flavescens]|uniref:cupin domain-containing protein n=1 Tax=Sedimentimonas flavescens TaxID=2851012 RepID=UPI0021A80394|nr:cupin domain-containing protein [Sedimentimonas flavescens]MCT2540308.1 cupin domain-containing protein [Sedimentimonas flavescens]
MTASDTALWFLNTRVRIVVPAASGSDGLSVIKHWAPYEDSPPLHIHDTEDEVFHVIEGRVRFSVGGQVTLLAAGQTIMAPKGIGHSYVVESHEGAKWLTVTRPGDFEAFVRETARPATAPGLPAPSGPPTPEMAAALTAACARHGIRMVGEPLRPSEKA